MLASPAACRERWAGMTPSAATGGQPEVSVFVPVHNEEANIEPLLDRLYPVLDGMFPNRPDSYEVVVVNDGSRDGSLARLRAEVPRRRNLVVVDLRRNYGQTAAMKAGIDIARGRVLVSLDADLQNFPEDIPALLAKLDEGFDVVSGWRKDRKDAKVRRNFLSAVANGIISRVSGVRLNDYGCTLKAYRSEVIKEVRLFGEMHRFIPIYAHWMGARIAELPVRHAARSAGQSKYGMERIFKVMCDMVTIKFLDRYLAKPIYVFGAFTAGFGVLAVAVFALSLYLKFARGVSMILTPLPTLAGVLLLAAVMSLLLGLVAEIVVRIYFETRGGNAYSVRNVWRAPGGES
ncbi:MAG: glycosyltransferase family 2 protein [Candidatus Didemnitutus sp.]|nr:glycosyltransferase family 2 protein [Candidatus Didemnitutus sp.]